MDKTLPTPFKATYPFRLAAPSFIYPADYFSSNEVLTQDLAEPLLPSRDGTDGSMRIQLWSDPGIGIEPDAALLEKLCLAQTNVV